MATTPESIARCEALKLEIAERKKQKRKENNQRHRENNRAIIRRQNREYYQRHLEEQRDRSRNKMRVAYQQDPEKYNEQCRRYHRRNRNKQIARCISYHLKNKYGLTVEAKRQMFALQGNRCAVCGSDKTDKRGRWHVDHCHEAERNGRMVIRGILCSNCNSGIGLFKDKPDALRAAAAYLERHKPLTDVTPEVTYADGTDQAIGQPQSDFGPGDPSRGCDMATASGSMAGVLH